MKLCAPTKIDDHITIIGDMGLPSYLIGARYPMVFDAGMSFMAPLYARALEDVLTSRQPSFLCITHSHYDHLGACSFIKRRFPDIRIAAHGLAAQVLKNPRAIASMTDLSNIARQLMNATDGSTEFLPPEIDIVLKEGDTLNPGEGIVVTVIGTPGHTRDSLTYHIEPCNAVVPGEALGVVQLDGRICPEFLADFDSYVESIQKIVAKKPELILMPHGPSLTGDDAAELLESAIPAAFAWRDMIEEALDEAGQEIDKATEKLFARLYDPSVIGQEMNAFRVNLRAKVACIGKASAGTRPPDAG
jgi:glyoxylase-like metal-dependent hydrolase (beta-lactamase superfamily II)